MIFLKIPLKFTNKVNRLVFNQYCCHIDRYLVFKY